MEYCPDCVVVLKPEKRKFGEESKWLVCPACGYRARPTSQYLIDKQLDEFEQLKDRINANGREE